jgi:hypothetical protein
MSFFPSIPLAPLQPKELKPKSLASREGGRSRKLQLALAFGSMLLSACGLIAKEWSSGGEQKLPAPAIAVHPTTRVIIFGLDGAGYDQLLTAINSGRAPHLEALMGTPRSGGVFEHAYSVPNAISILPSTTIAAWSSIFTGQPPAYTGITGNEWFVRDQMQFYAPAPVSISETEDTRLMITNDLVGALVRVPTLYELVAVRSNVSLSQIYRGATLYTTIESSDVVDMTAAFLRGVVGNASGRQEVYAAIDQDSVTKLISSLDQHGVPNLQVVYFPGIDLYTHLAADPLNMEVNYLESVTDSAIGRVLDAYTRLNAINDTYVLFIADHGHTPVLNDDRHALGISGDQKPPALVARGGFRLRPFVLNPAADSQDYQAAFAYQGAMAYVYLADRSTCPNKGERCKWERPPRFAQDVMPVVRAFYKCNKTGSPFPDLKNTLDLIFARPAHAASENRAFQIFDGRRLVPIYNYLVTHPRPDLLRLDERMRWLAVGPYGDHAGDILLLARSGLQLRIEDRYYFSGPYHSWHGSPTAQDSHVPFIIAHLGDSGDRLKSVVDESIGRSPSQLDLVPLIQHLFGQRQFRHLN